jgi:hypothetical protein
MDTWMPNPGDQLRGRYHDDEEKPSVEMDDGTRWAIPEDARTPVKELEPDDGAEILLVFQGEDPENGLGLFNVALPQGGSGAASAV